MVWNTLNHIQSFVKAYCAKIAKINPADANTIAIFFMGELLG